MNSLKVNHINTGYNKKQVLFDVSLEVEEGEVVLLIGANGSGKSTLFKTIYGQLPIWEDDKGAMGQVIFNGEDITNLESWQLIKKGIMYVPQKNELFENITLEQNLEMALLHLSNKAERKKRIIEVLDQVNILKEKRNQLASKLSGGERKLLLLGMVVINNPKLLLFDEPLAGLSGENVTQMLTWLKRIQNNGTTLVVIEHRIKELINLADEVVGLKLGKRNEEPLINLDNIKSYMI